MLSLYLWRGEEWDLMMPLRIKNHFVLGVAMILACSNCKKDMQSMVVVNEDYPRYKLPDVCAPVAHMTAGEYSAKLARENGEKPCSEGTIPASKIIDGVSESWCEREGGGKEGLYRKTAEGYYNDVEYRNGVAIVDTIYNTNRDGFIFREEQCEVSSNECTERWFTKCGFPVAFKIHKQKYDGIEVEWHENGIMEKMIFFSNDYPGGPWLQITDDGWRISTGFLDKIGHIGPSFEWLLPGCGYENACQSDSPACHLCTGEYEDGKRVGRWTEWSANGRRKLAIYEYEDGKLVKEKKLD
jgi:hypothetical protein